MPSAGTCAKCGDAISPGDRFCPRCGADVSGAQGNVATAYGSQADLARATAPEAALLDLLRQATLGDYDVQAELGRGGMASVFLAHDIALDRKVAVKVMSPALLTGEGMAERFKREARTAASLSHPNIIPIYAVQQSAHLLFFVMKVTAAEGRLRGRQVRGGGPLVALFRAKPPAPPPPIAQARPDLPPRIAAAVMRMLEKEPGKRFSSVEEAVKALGGTPMDLDDPRREAMKLLAKMGTASELRPRVKTPASPVTAGRTPPPTAASASVPTTHIRERTRPGAKQPGPKRLGWVLPVAALALLAGVAVAVTRPWASRPAAVAPGTRPQELSHKAPATPESTAAEPVASAPHLAPTS